MKIIALLIPILISLQIFAEDHSHHAKHNMILFGEANAYYASHIVYKVPHNFQILLKIKLPSVVKEKVAAEMISYPDNEFIYLLNNMDISQINQKPIISGQIFRRTADGSKQIIFGKVELQPEEYSVIYFDELPLSLNNIEDLYNSKRRFL